MKKISLIIFFLALFAIGVYVALSNKKSPQELVKDIPSIPQLTNPEKVFLDISNQELEQTVKSFIDLNSKKYQLVKDKLQADIVIDNAFSDGAIEIFKEPLVAVVSPRVLINNISQNDLKNSVNQIEISGYSFNQIVGLNRHKNYITTQINPGASDKIALLSDSTSIIDLVSQNQQAIGLVPFSDLDIKVHPLSVDNINPLNNPHEYPLQISTYIHSPKKTIPENLINEIKKNITDKPITSLLAVGDIMMGRFVGVKISRSGNPAHSFEFVSDYLAKPDFTFAQLEAPLASGTALTSEGMILVAQPETVAGLVKSGIDLVFLSSNHFGDALRSGMEDNFQILEKNKIVYVGAGRNEEEAFSYKIQTIKDTKYAFLSFVNIMPDSYGASGNIAGTAWVDFNSDADLQKVKTLISLAKKQSDIVIVCFHWGTEYTPDPTAQQIKFAHEAIDSGADLIVGTHPHVVQANEIYKDKYIIYSLGNFIMDQMWSQETQEGVLMPFYVQNKKIISLDLIPTHVIDYSQVKIISKEEGSTILNRIFTASDQLRK